MVKKTQWIWYRTNQDARQAFLFNCRQRDLVDGSGIARGTIVRGKKGFVVAESAVPDVTGNIVPYKANRRCEWQGLELDCLADPIAPTGADVPRDFNYIVAELPREKDQQLARKLGVPVILTNDGKALANLEISRFKNQGKARRAALTQ